MATLANPITIARELAHTNSDGLTDALCIDFANFASLKLRKALIDRGIDAAPVQEATRDLVDSQGTYLYPSDMFYRPKYVEINWFENPVTNTSNRWKQADKIEYSNILPDTAVETLRKNQDFNKPLVDYLGDYYEIFPTVDAKYWGGTSGSGATLTGALRIFYYLTPTLYTATSDTLTYPESTDYHSFGELIKHLFFYSLEKISKEQLESYFANEVNRIVRIVQGDSQQQTRPKGIGWTGYEF